MVTMKQLFNFTSKLVDNMTLFENKQYLILNKFSNTSIQGGQLKANNIYTLLKEQKKKVYIVQRLDQNTTGLVFLAKTKKAAQHFSNLLFEKDEIQKWYIALGQGYPIFTNQIQKQGIISLKQRFDLQKQRTISSFFTNKDFYEAKTEYDILGFIMYESNQDSIDLQGFKFINYSHPSQNDLLRKFKKKDKAKIITIYKLRILNGRKHQIRSHLMTQFGTPILFDGKYGFQPDDTINKFLLQQIKNTSPLSKNLVQFSQKNEDQSSQKGLSIRFKEQQQLYDHENNELESGNIMGLHAYQYILPGNLFSQEETLNMKAKLPLWMETLFQHSFKASYSDFFDENF